MFNQLMEKKMKTKNIILCLGAFLLASCGEIDESNMKQYPSKLYMGTNGYKLEEIYDLGGEKLEWPVCVYKSGYFDRVAEVEVVYDPTALTDYQKETFMGTDYEVLPENVGVLGQKKLTLAGDETMARTMLTFDMDALRAVIPKDVDAKYVYPLRVKKISGEAEVNTDKDYLLLAIQLYTPQAKLRWKGSVVEANCDPWRNTGMDKLTVPLAIDLTFENKDMDLTFEYGADLSLVEEYNRMNGTNYTGLSADCITSAPELVIRAGETSASIEVEINPANMQPAVEKTYSLLPIRIKGCNNPSLKIQDGAVMYVSVSTKAQWAGSWTMTILPGESGISTSVGGVSTVKLYTLEGMKNSGLGDDRCQNIVNHVSDPSVIFSPGWGGTFWDQTTQAFKVTDQDAGNGRKRVEITYGWNGDINNYQVTNNNSWWDPATETLHIEYDGVYDWGNYSVRRNFTNPQYD